jgi:hypothetical protein
MRENDKPSAKEFLLIQLGVEFLERPNVVESLRRGVVGVSVRSRADAQRMNDLREKIDRKLGIEEKQCLAGHCQRKLHSGKDDEPILGGQRLSALVRFVQGRVANVLEEADVVVVGNRDSLEPFDAARS